MQEEGQGIMNKKIKFNLNNIFFDRSEKINFLLKTKKELHIRKQKKIMVSTLTLADAKVELEKLITSGEVQYNSGIIGCCKNYFITFPNDNQKYKYNRDKLISNKLKNKISSHLYNMSPKSSKQNTPTISDNVIKTLQNWIKKNKDSFKQEDHAIQIIYDVTIKENNKVITQEYSYDVINVYGGKIKIRKAIEDDLKSTYLYLKDNYDFELISLKIKRIFIDDIKMDVEDFKDIQMFGTLLNLQ